LNKEVTKKMPKKGRAARRRKNAMPMGEEGNENGGIDDDALSENYTIADTTRSVNSMDNDYIDEFDEEGGIDEGYVPERETKLLDALSLASTVSSEKQASKREKVLRHLFKCITQYATGEPGREIMESRLDSAIIPACTTGLRGGVASPAEQYAACRVLEATSLILGGDMDEYCESIDKMLRRVIRATGRSPQVRGSALRALSLAHFICGSDDYGSNSVLDLCEEVCAPKYRGEDVAPTLRAVALDCWALLSTTVHDAYIAGDMLDQESGRGVIILPLLSDCLNQSNVDLRCAAGECVALIHEARLNLGIDDDEGVNTTERRFRRGSWDGTDMEVLMDEVKQRVAELSVESGHHMSKKAKKEQRSTFRDFMTTIVDDESPSEIVSFRGGQLILNDWKHIIQLNFIRHCLQGGFQIQLMTNSTLHLVFNADAQDLNNASNNNLSQIEKRLIMSKTSEAAKSADKKMTRQRRSRTNAQNYFITADEAI